MVFLPSLSARSIVKRGGGWDGWWVKMGSDGVGWGGVEHSRNPCLGHSISSHDAHTVANDTPLGYIVSESKSMSPLPIWHPPCVPFLQE